MNEMIASGEAKPTDGVYPAPDCFSEMSMSRTIRMRLQRLERSVPTGDIPVWCDLPEEVPATIDAMIAAGEISHEERGRSVFWECASFAAGAHEAALSQLD